MKALGTILIVAAVAGSACAADWREVPLSDSSGKAKFAIDRTSAEISGTVVVVWVKREIPNFAKTVDLGQGPVPSVSSLDQLAIPIVSRWRYLVQCATRSYGIAATHEINAFGKVIRNENTPTDSLKPSEIVPDTMSEYIYNLFCPAILKSQKPKPPAAHTAKPRRDV